MNTKTLPHSKDICQTQSFKKKAQIEGSVYFQLGFYSSVNFNIF